MNSKYFCRVYQIRAIVVNDDSTISSYIPFRHKHILFSFVLRVCTVSNHDLHSYYKKVKPLPFVYFCQTNSSTYNRCKRFRKIDRNHKKKTPNPQIS